MDKYLFCPDFDCQYYVFINKSFVSPTSLVGNIPIKSVKREIGSEHTDFMICKKFDVLRYFSYG